MVLVERGSLNDLQLELFHLGFLCLDRYSHLFASRGANIVVNDFNAIAAQKVVDEITRGTYLTFSVLANTNHI